MPQLPRLRAASGELLHLDLLRFIACLGIVFHHSVEFFYTPDQRPALDAHTMGLALFVDLFFVISGYVIAHVYHNRIATKADYFRFLQRRIGRLIPLHWVTLVVAMALWSAFVVMHYAANHTPSFNPLCIADTLFLTHGFIPCEKKLYFNGVSWSISAEMVMYIAVPLFAFIGAKGARYLLGFGLMALTAIIGFAYMQQGLAPSELSWVNVPPVLRALPSFILGGALFFNRGLVSRLPAPDIILALATTGLIAAMLSGTPQLFLLPLVYLVAIAAVSADSQGGVAHPCSSSVLRLWGS